jgi:hypothetical protein
MLSPRLSAQLGLLAAASVVAVSVAVLIQGRQNVRSTARTLKAAISLPVDSRIVFGGPAAGASR